MSSRPPSALRTARLWCVVASAAVLVTSVLLVGSMTPGYRPMADTVSRLGSAGQPHAIWIQVVFVLYGLLVLAGAGPLGDHAPRRHGLLAAAIAGYAAAAVVAGLAPKDPPDVPTTLASQVHVDATIVGGAMILVAMGLVASCAPDRIDRWIAGTVAALTASGVIVFRFTWGSSFYGLVERGVLGVTVLWLALLATRLLAEDRGRRGGRSESMPRSPMSSRGYRGRADE